MFHRSNHEHHDGIAGERAAGHAALGNEHAEQTTAVDSAGASACCASNAGDAAVGMTAEPVAAGIRTAMHIAQMDCPTEEALVRSKLGGMVGVHALEFNLVRRELTIVHEAGILDAVQEAMREIGFTPQIRPAGAVESRPAMPPHKPWWPLVAAGALALGAEAAEWFGLGTPWLPPVFALAAVALSGLSVYKNGWIALRNGKLNINALMTIAVTGAMLIGVWPEAAMVMVLFAIAERIEAASLDRARNAICGLLAMTPQRATVRQPDGAWHPVDANAVPVGVLVRLKPGERVPLDGKVVRGSSTVDQAPITGESVPVDKQAGDLLFAGTINQSGELEYETTAKAADSTLARIIHAVEAAQGSRAPTQRFVDRFARIYTPAVFVLAVAVALLPPLLLGSAWFDSVYRALVLLVIACPCALVISTPITIISGLAAATRHGILIKGGVYLEQGRKLRWLALDKTGTITHGKPALTDFTLIASRDHDAYDVAASLATRSDHPISKAIAVAAPAKGAPFGAVEGFAALPGRGVKGRIGGRDYHLGNHRLLEELGLCSPALEARLNALERQGKSAVVLSDAQGALALFGVADTVKETSRHAVAELHALGVKTLMLSGDNPHTAAAIAAQVGIDEARGNQLPEDKAAAVGALAGPQGKVGMAGDGINDAPALARADIGFAMGAAGTDAAIETADVALMDDDLRKIPIFVRLSRATSRVLKQNIALALGIKGAFLVLTAAGLATMWMAVFADMGASLLVVGNGLRLLRK